MGGQFKIKELLERKLLTPAYVLMISGLLIRSVALVISVAVPYATWPIFLRLAIELFAALGMVGAADMILSFAAGTWAQLDMQIDAVMGSPDYVPNPRLNREKFDQQSRLLNERRDRVLGGLKREKGKERVAVFFCGGVTVSYGLLFGLTVMTAANPVAIAVEVIGVAMIPFATWYLSAQYKGETVSPETTAKGLALASVDGRLQAAKDRFASGGETVEDVKLLATATEGSAYHQRLVRALRKPDTSVKYLTLPEVYAAIGAISNSERASARRLVRKAGMAEAHGVIYDDETKAWLTPRQAVFDIFPRLLGGEHRRTRANIPEQSASAAQVAPGVPRTFASTSEHITSTLRTSPEYRADYGSAAALAEE